MRKRKYKKRFLAYLLAALLCILGFPAGEDTVLAAGKSVKASEKYLKEGIVYHAFGDSIATGYGLPGYIAGEGDSAPDAYRKKVAGYLQENSPEKIVHHQCLAVDGLDSAHFLDALTNPENEQYEQYRRAVAEADVLTLSIGSNDILIPFMEAVAEAFGCSLGDLYAKVTEIIESGDIGQWFQTAEIVENLNKSLAGLSEDMDSMAAAEAIAAGNFEGRQDFNQRCEAFAQNFAVIVSELRALAPDAVLCVTNIYNPYRDAQLTNPLSGICIFNMAALSQFYIDRLNEAFSAESGDYILVDVAAAFASCEVVPVNCNIRGHFGTDFGFDNYNVDPHPNVQGHEKIASLLAEKLEGISIEGGKRKFLPLSGTQITAGNLKFVLITTDNISGELRVAGSKKAVKKLVIPNQVTIGSYILPVTVIGKGAWKKDKKLTTLTVGANIRTIKKQAFYQCKKLKKVKVLSKKIEEAGAKSFSSIHKKAVFSFPKSCQKRYKKLLE